MLGPLEIRGRSGSVSLPGSRARELLMLFAMRANRPISAKVLIDELWEAKPPPTAANAFRVHVSHARRSLETSEAATSSKISHGPAGYTLHVTNDELDSLRFESLVASGREADRCGDAGRAEEQFAAALRCWRGPAFADIRHLCACQAEVSRLDQLHASAIAEYSEVCLALGNHVPTIELLSEATREFPLDESMSRALMLAHYRCGRPALALRTFAELKHRLAGVGLEPSAELRRLETDILLERPELDFVGSRPPRRAVAFASSASNRMIGRTEELRRLLEVHDAVALGGRRLIVVSGPAGIGKTTLVAAYCERASRRGAAVLIGRCERGGAHRDRAVVEIVRAALPLLDDSTREELSVDLDVLFGAGPVARGDIPSDVDQTSLRLRLREAIANAIGSISRRPVVVVVEDLHASDRSTLDVLRFLLRHPAADRLLVVATYRDDEPNPDIAETLSALAPRRYVTNLELVGFDDHEARALIRTTCPMELTSTLLGVALTLRDTTGGNPFHLRELLRELTVHRTLTCAREELERTIAALAPDGVRTLIDARTEHLSPVARDVVRIAAVLGTDASDAILAAARNDRTQATSEAVYELLDARMLREHEWEIGRFEFPHALVRNAVYAAIADDERARLHLCVANALEAAATQAERDPAALAYHYARVGTAEATAKAAGYARRAGDDATTRLAFAEATKWYELALRYSDETGRPEARTGVLHLALGRAYEAERQFAKARDNYCIGATLAIAHDDRALLVDLAIAANGPWSSGLGFQTETRRLLEDALALSEHHTDVRSRVRLLTRLATSLYYVDVDREGSLTEEALSLATGVSDKTPMAEAQLARHLWLTHVPTARVERLELADAAMRLAREVGSSRMQLRVGRELLADLLENGEVERFDTALDSYEKLATKACSPYDIYWSMGMRATQATLYGDLHAAEQLARGAKLRGQELEQDALGLEVLQQFVVRYQQGRLPELVGLLRKTTELQPAYRAGSALAALACAETGRVDEAVRISRSAVAADGGAIARDSFWIGAVALLSGAVATAQNVDLARALDDSLGPCADHIVTFGAGGAVLGCGHHWLGLLAATLDDDDRSAEHLAEAERVSERLGAPYWRAQAQVDLALTLSRRARRGDATSARRLAVSACGIAESHGFDRILHRAATML